MNNELKAMFDGLAAGDSAYLPSKFWEKLNKKNISQLDDGGIDLFKQTIAQNYFTWVIGIKDQQFKYLIRNTRISDWPKILEGIFSGESASSLPLVKRIELTLFTKMLWALAKKVDVLGLLEYMEEPSLGSPFKIYFDGKLISQDLANSILEFYSIHEMFSPKATERFTIAELGAGYGRDAYVLMNAYPRCRYIIVDIPPALYIAQNYLTRIFPERKTFPFRNFQEFDKVSEEMDASDMIFLLPHQVESIKNKSVNLFLNISSLHEMTYGQIDMYLKLIDRLTDGFFYTKQWKVSVNPEDNISVSRNDYPIPTRWKNLYLRTPKVQVHFFEAMYKIPG